MKILPLFSLPSLPLREKVNKLLACNVVSSVYGLSLSAKEAAEVAKAHDNALLATRRVEPADTVTPKIIYAFCDSPFISPYEYAQTITSLLEIFYYFKTESNNTISDDELINLMATAFNTSCQGSTELLRGRELEHIMRITRGILPQNLFEEEGEDE